MKKDKKKKSKIPMILKLFDYREIVYDIMKWAAGWPLVLYYRVKRIYHKTKRRGLFRGSYIISANHISFTDIFKVGVTFPLRRVGYVATEELFSTKLKTWFFNRVGCIPIDRNNVSYKTFKEVEARLSRGHLVTVFPEGTISRDGNGNSYKSGVILMALMADVPILPIYYGKKEKWYHRQKVVVGPKFYVKDYLDTKFPSVDEINEVADKLKEIETELKEKYHNS
ncbi:MAG: lysophospholipid acyltransferase family protein [Acholeplasmataceae bacterium]|jgi:1-acyl-sn-glycerol-3-phosphate acyltransferase